MTSSVEVAREWLTEVAVIAESIPTIYVANMARLLRTVRQKRGRVFVLGIGGSAANASHAVNDLRKIAGIEAYAPTDNIAELTALANDCGWHLIFEYWLKESNLASEDAILVLSVNGGTEQYSPNLVTAIDLARSRGSLVLSIVGRKDGYAATHATEFIAIPCPNENHRTPHSESFQAIIWHLLCWMLRD